jgi:galactose mutarotase-like enzyme
MNSRPVRIDTNWHYHGLRALVLENSQLRLTILPELGGKLWSLRYKPRDREIFWHNPRVGPRLAPYGAAYDDWFCGGWDELFPNDAPTTCAGDAYPDHGEWWAMPFTWAITTQQPDEVTVHLQRAGIVTDTLVERWITLQQDKPGFTIRYRLHNAGRQPLDFLWKLHPALAISPQARIDLPPSTVQPDPGFNDRLDKQPFDWPQAHGAGGEAVDMRVVPPADAAACDFYYATNLAGGWCALTDAQDGVGFGLAFDPAIFRSVWVFGAYGGWRGHYTAILEPCTGYPYQLETAVAQGTASRLAAGETLETTVTAVLYQGRAQVGGITAEGEVR